MERGRRGRQRLRSTTVVSGRQSERPRWKSRQTRHARCLGVRRSRNSAVYYNTWNEGANNGEYSTNAGTSLSCIIWAGLVAIADQGRVSVGMGTLDGATQTLPRLYNLPSSDFNDITTGSNGNPAGPGYDLATGLGTPIANLLVPDLAGTRPIVTNVQVNGDNPNGLFTAASQPAPGVQRSMVEDIVYTFNTPVSIGYANLAFTVAGTGSHPGIPPATLTAVSVPGSDDTQWAVTLTGKAPGVLASIANGTYNITINAPYITAEFDGYVSPLASSQTNSPVLPALRRYHG